MASAFDNLMRALKADGEDMLSCEECEERLSEYVVAVLNATADAPEWAAIRLHLAQCPYCTAAYNDLYDLVQATETGMYPVPTQMPEPDLGFLNSGQATNELTAQSWGLDALGRLIVSFTEEVRRSLELALAQPAPGLAGLKSSSAVGGDEPLTIASAGKQIVVTITFERVRDQLDLVRLVVLVEISERGGWPNLADSTVELMRGDQTIASSVTDAYGKVVFDGLIVAELDRLTLQVTPVA
jgi:hypothetical protein